MHKILTAILFVSFAINNVAYAGNYQKLVILTTIDGNNIVFLKKERLLAQYDTKNDTYKTFTIYPKDNRCQIGLDVPTIDPSAKKIALPGGCSSANAKGVLQPAGGGTVTYYVNPAESDTITSVANGTTALTGGVRLPEEGIGYRHFYGTALDLTNGDNFGTLRMIQIIESVGRDWNLLPGWTVDTDYVPRPRFSINDICSGNGGDWRGDGGHKTGRESDIRYVRTDGSEGQMDFNDPNTSQFYNQVETETLVRLLCKAGVKQIWVDLDRRSGLENLSIPGCNIGLWAGHANHFHVQLYQP